MRYVMQTESPAGGYTIEVFACLNNYRLGVYRATAENLADRLSFVCEKHRIDPEEIYTA